MKHYRYGHYFITYTQTTLITNSAKLYPTHCKMPTISEEDGTVLAAEELVKALSNKALKLNTEDTLRHAKVLQKLTAIIANKPPQRVAMQTPQRVDGPSTSNDTTAPRIVRTAKRIHQRKTRSNTPMPALPGEEPYTNWYDNQ